MVALFVAALLHGTLYAVVVPPFDTPDENAHYEYARLFGELGRLPRDEDRSPGLRAEVEQLMRERGVGLQRRLPSGQEQLVFASELGRQPPGYYALAAVAYGLTRQRPLPTQVLAMRLVSVALAALVVVLVALAARTAFPRDPPSWLAAPLLVLFLPGFAFIGAAVNNDMLAVLAMSLAIYGLLRHVRGQRHGLALATAGVVVALVAKRTAAAALPLVALVWLLSAARGARLRLSRRLALAAAAALVVLAGVTLAAALGPTERPAGWLFSPADAGQLLPAARSGELALALEAPAASEALAVQYLDREAVFRARGQPVEAEVWVRARQGRALVSLLVGDGQREEGASAEVDTSWTPLQLTRTVAPDAPSVYVKILLEQEDTARSVVLDDARLSIRDSGGQAINLLRTGDFETRAWELRPAAARLLRLVHLEPYILAVVLDPERYSAEAAESYGFLLRFAFESFWARFGWLTIPVARGWYDGLLVACAVALFGLPLALWRWRRSAGRQPGEGWAVAVLAAAALLTSAMALLPYLAGALPQEWPQGRYLYPGVLPLALLTTFGLRAWLPDRYAAGGLLLVASGLAAFDALCLVGYLLPHYYGA
ncbi:MAG: glycosyltransferase family 39 protein [Chloroflexi bacterium]|nr:glycosyltransferase family 39 protein [Chloroflexota bacterium]